MSIDTTFKVKNGVEVPDAEKLFTTDTPLTSKPSLNLIFNKTEYLDSRITFTRSGTATRTNSRGLIESVTADKARFDYDPITGVSKGLLIEEARTNLLRYSEDFNDSTWLYARSTVTANQAISPKGILDADKLVEDTSATNTHYLYQPIAVITGTTYTYSLYAKSAERTRVSIIAFATNSAFTSSTAIFNLTTGAITRQDAGFSSATITNAGNGWYRCSISIVAAATVSGNIGIGIADLDAALTYTGDGVSGLYIWGSQVEAATFATSYIPSTNTFTSRASVGSYFDSTGTLQSAAINTARYQYNTSNLSVAPFLLLEEARTNSIRNNTMVGTVSGVPGTTPTNWQTTGISGISYDVAGVGTENGINYIDIRVSGTSTVNSYAGITPDILIAGASGQTWTGSYWMKLVSGSFANTNANLEIRETDATQTFLTNTLTPLSLTSALTRYTQTRTLNNASTAFVSLRFVAQVSIGLAVDFTVRIGLPQLELGAYATTPILTSTAALTRSADISSSAASTRGADLAQINTLTPWYNTAQGTLYGEAASFENANANVVFFLYGTDTTFRTQITVGTSGAAAYMQDSVVQANLISLSTTPANTINNKVALAYKLDDTEAALNGTLSAIDTSCTIPSVLTARIGCISTINSVLNGYVKRISYFPRRLSSTELVALTT